MTQKVLVVDDNEDNRRILHDLLTAAGFEVIEATTGEDAVARADGEAIDLVLMDIQLPGIGHARLTDPGHSCSGRARRGDWLREPSGATGVATPNRGTRKQSPPWTSEGKPWT